MRTCLVAVALLALGCSVNTTPNIVDASIDAGARDTSAHDTGIDASPALDGSTHSLQLHGECAYPNDVGGCAVPCSLPADSMFLVVLHWNGADYPCASSPGGRYESWSICRCNASGFVECADAPGGLYALPRMRCEVIGGGDAGPDAAATGDAG